MGSKSKVFCIGLNKTGTTSLHKALKVLGYKSIHFKDDEGNKIKPIIEANFYNKEDILKGLNHYDAFSDWGGDQSSHLIFKEFDKQYPGSKFILNTRNLEDWLNSREKHVLRNQKIMEENPERNLTWLKVDRESWTLHFERHHDDIRKYFQNREHDLLEIDVTEGDGWEKLCKFLGHKIPKIPFPNLNKAPSLYQKSKKMIRNLLRKLKLRR